MNTVSLFILVAEVAVDRDAITNGVYAGRDQTPISKRERRTKLTKLVDYDLLGSDGDTLGREYGPRDASISSPVDLTVPVL